MFEEVGLNSIERKLAQWCGWRRVVWPFELASVWTAGLGFLIGDKDHIHTAPAFFAVDELSTYIALVHILEHTGYR